MGLVPGASIQCGVAASTRYRCWLAAKSTEVSYHEGVTYLKAAAIGFVLLFCAACATSTRQTKIDSGTVTVGVTTTDASAKTLTFRVTIEPAGVEGSVKADAGVFTRGGIPQGDQTVRLLDVPAKCRIEGSAERKITIVPRGSAVVRFTVRCQ